MPFDGAVPVPGDSQSVLVFEPPANFAPDIFADADLLIQTTDAPTAARLSRMGLATTQSADTTADVALVFLPRNRVQSLGLIARAAAALNPGGWLLIDGGKDNGVDATLKQVKSALPLDGTAARDHGKIAWAQNNAPLPPEIAAWAADAQPTRNADGFLTAPGMFSADGIDPATAMLSQHLTGTAKGRAADLGAGWGALSQALLTAAPDITHLDLIEADFAALEAAKSNITDPRAHFHWADATTWTGSYDFVVANPPFHTSRRADPALGAAFISAAARILTPKGTFLMVANRQLPYERSLDQAFKSWEQLALDNRFKVLRATRPKSAR